MKKALILFIFMCSLLLSSCRNMPLDMLFKNNLGASSEIVSEASSSEEDTSYASNPIPDVPIKEPPSSEPILYPVFWEDDEPNDRSLLIGFLDQDFNMVIEPRYTSYSLIANSYGDSAYYVCTHADAGFDVINTNAEVVLSSEIPLSFYDIQKTGDYLVYRTEEINAGDVSRKIYNIKEKTEVNLEGHVSINSADVSCLGSAIIAVDLFKVRASVLDTDTGDIKYYDHLNIKSLYGGRSDDLLAALHTNGLWGYLSYSNGQLEWAIEPQFVGAHEFNGDYAYVITRDAASWDESLSFSTSRGIGIIDKQGDIVATEDIGGDTYFTPCSTENFFYDVRYPEEDYSEPREVTVYDHNLKAVWGPFPGDYLHEDENGFFTVRTEYESKQTFIFDGENEIVLPYEFYCSERLNNGCYLGIVSTETELYKDNYAYKSEYLIIDEKGEEVDRCRNIFSFGGDIIWKTKGSVQGYTDLEGNWYYRESAYQMLMD